MNCSKQLRSDDTCGLRPSHRGQHRGSRTLSYCDGCDRPMYQPAGHTHDREGDIVASFCFMCVRGL